MYVWGGSGSGRDGGAGNGRASILGSANAAYRGADGSYVYRDANNLRHTVRAQDGGDNDPGSNGADGMWACRCTRRAGIPGALSQPPAPGISPVRRCR
ncbi:hypothetical protein [Streptomyces albipurpureus]|uniref:Uncharacterized protein n=1 Tax=Streptomyces albipurpureus TaxID=2897419 RepID=A0ABT0UGC2_9ACTN|nr:hypothetical protein [Streptomyces sp. CWNU-1]MCM2387201.1 hypothetical protein [Streptomyces sp. CWNU-1]